jgi:hypothetical protein
MATSMGDIHVAPVVVWWWTVSVQCQPILEVVSQDPGGPVPVPGLVVYRTGSLRNMRAKF